MNRCAHKYAHARYRQDEDKNQYMVFCLLLQAMLNTVATLARVAPTVSLPTLMEHICDVLVKPTLTTVTSEEYQIMLTPEGELFDKSILGR